MERAGLAHGLLVAHIVVGALGLGTGVVAMLARKSRGAHTRAGEIYHWAVLATAITGGLLALLDPARLWGFVPVAVAMYGFAFVAYRSAKRRRGRWLLVHPPCQLASYLFMSIATLTTNWELVTRGADIPNGYAWLIPALVFYPAIAFVYVRARRSYGTAEAPSQAAAAPE